ncbi:MAG: N4-gp56 family major capsid protein [Streptococcaceae bacterium]|jgi:N4-gp56 family major capsid protein|nr:N4-gp56 family major capsid protein [Streptococcaceae bacterium]
MKKRFNLQIFDAPTDLTMLENLVNPQVLAPMVAFELEAQLRFTPLAEVDNTLVGQPGNTITFPAFTYIGDAKDFGEGEMISYGELDHTTKEATVKKAGRGVKITDEAALSGYGDPIGEGTRQIGLAIANKIDNDMLETARETTQHKSTGATVEGISEILDMYNDEDAQAYVLIVSPLVASQLRMDANERKVGSDVGANALISGTYADILGVQIVRSKKLAADEGIMVKVTNSGSPAFKLIHKRGVQLERERDIDRKFYKINADQHYVPYLYDESKVIKVTFLPSA